MFFSEMGAMDICSAIKSYLIKSHEFVKSEYKLLKSKSIPISIDTEVSARIGFPRTDLEPWEEADDDMIRFTVLGDCSVVVGWMIGVYKGTSDVLAVSEIRELPDIFHEYWQS